MAPRKQAAKRAAAKKPRGRPAHQPTKQSREFVEILAGMFVPIERIADVLDICRNTLLKHYEAELRRGSALVESKLISNVFKIAGGQDGTALKANMFLLNCRFGWTQYAPPPKEPSLGKKEQADQEAQVAHEGNEWGELIEQAQRLQ